MDHLKRWWWVLVALLGGLAFFLTGRNPWQDRAIDGLAGKRDAQDDARRERKARKEAEADAELDSKRSGNAADRLRGALDRARKRRERG